MGNNPKRLHSANALKSSKAATVAARMHVRRQRRAPHARGHVPIRLLHEPPRHQRMRARGPMQCKAPQAPRRAPAAHASHRGTKTIQARMKRRKLGKTAQKNEEDEAQKEEEEEAQEQEV